MADGVFRYQQGQSSPFPPHNPHNASGARHANRRQPSPGPHSRFELDREISSPSRSPGRRASPPPHRPFNMYSQNHQPGHNIFMNGGHSHQRYGMQGNSKPFQSSSHHHQNHNHRSQDHFGQSHGNFVSHQHNSSGGFNGASAAFAPSAMRGNTPGHLTNGINRAPNEHWQKQLQLYAQSRETGGHHFHARNSNTSKGPGQGPFEGGKKETDKEERFRTVNSNDSNPQQWNELDMSGQGLRALAPQLFGYSFLTSLYLNHNKITYLPQEIGRLRKLVHLDLSGNNLQDLPSEIGMLVNLKTLWLFDNHLETLPNELGYLHQLEILGVEGNPLADDYRSVMVEEGTKSMITMLREQMQVPDVEDRALIEIHEVAAKGAQANTDTFSIMSYNILCDKAASRTHYGYTPETALMWETRRAVILDELESRDGDILCLQEIDTENFHEYFRPELARKDYKGVFWPKTRARTMAEKETRTVDGCAIFYKNSKYVMLDKQPIELSGIAIKRPDMRSEHDLFNRVMPKDHIAIVAFLEERQTGSRLMVVNTHICWEAELADVKAVQIAILMEEVTRIAEQYSKHPPCKDKSLYRFAEEDADGETDKPSPLAEPGPSLEYPNGQAIPLVICGDFNSLPGSGVHQLLNTGSLAPDHPDLGNYKYGSFTREGMGHPFQLKSAYGEMGELKFTNYTPGFTGVIDYIWYAANALQVLELLGDIDPEYLKRVPGFPNVHFPSDHISLLAKFSVKQQRSKERPKP